MILEPLMANQMTAAAAAAAATAATAAVTEVALSAAVNESAWPSIHSDAGAPAEAFNLHVYEMAGSSARLFTP